MKTKLCRPILVESKERTNIWGSGHKMYYNRTPEEPRTPCYQLILISLEDEDIEVGDKIKWYVLPIDESWITVVTQEMIDIRTINGECYLANECSKVIATQSQLSPEYINQFIAEYNNSTVKDVEIEMQDWCDYDDDNTWPGGFDTPDWRPKLTNGFVTIVKKELSKDESDKEIIESVFGSIRSIIYTEEEVKKLCLYAMEYAQDSRDYPYELIDKWFNNNKKE